MAPNLYGIYRQLERVPLGRQVTSGLLQLAAPYFLTIPASITSLEPGHGTARMFHAPWVRNHLGTVHAISLCNLAEFVMGAVAEATVPAETHRWVPRGMQVHYTALAKGTMYADCTLELPEPLGDRVEAAAAIEVTDGDGQRVFDASIDLWITAKKTAAAA